MSDTPQVDQQPTAASAGTERFGRFDAVALLGICSLALVIRLAYLTQIRAVPFFASLVVDAKLYDAWAQRIAAGDWIGEGVFYQAPLYPYFMGVLYKVFGRDLGLVRLLQLVLGAISCGLMYLVCRSLFSRRAAVAAGLILAFYAPAFFFEGLIQKAGLALFFEMLLLWLLARAQEKPTGLRWLFAGLSLGLLSLTWENARILLPVILIWLAIHFAAHSWRRRIIWAVLLGAGVCAVLLPVGVRNRLVGGEFVLSTSQAGFMFYIGNNENARGVYQPLVPGRQDNTDREDSRMLAEQALGRELTDREVSHYWFDQAFAFMRSQPLAWCKLQARKLVLAWNRYEISDSVDYYFYQDWSWLLRVFDKVFNLGVVCPLAVAGIVLTRRRARELWWLYALLAAIVAGIVVFFIFSRYRFPMVPVLILFAGPGIIEMVRHVRRKGAGAAPLLLAVLPAVVVCNWDVPESKDMRALSYTNYGSVLAQQGDYADALAQYRKGLALVPDDSQGHFDAGTLAMRLRDLDQAVAHFREAAEVDPGYYDAYLRWGAALGLQGRFDEAADCFVRAIQVRPGKADAYNDLGFALANLGRFDEAEQSYARALEILPASEQTVANLLQMYMERRRYPQAVALLEQAVKHLPDSAIVLDNLAWLLVAGSQVELRDPQRALRLAEHLCELGEYGVPSHLDTLAGVYAAVGRFDDARRTLQKAIDIAEAAGVTEAVEAFREQMKMYEAGLSPTGAPETQPAQSAGGQE